MKNAFTAALAFAACMALALSAAAEPGKQEPHGYETPHKLSDNASQGKPGAESPKSKAGETPAALHVKSAEMKQNKQKSKKDIFEALDELKARGHDSMDTAK